MANTLLGLLLPSLLLCCGKSTAALKSILTVSPSWLSPGASVNLSCEVKPSSPAGWRFYWYKAVPDLSKNSYRYDPLPGSISETVKNSSIIHGQKQTAGFTCRAGRRNPEDFTEYSEPKFIWSADSHPAASLTVSPNKEKLFTIDEIKLNCEGSSADWRVRRFKESYYEPDLSHCSNWGTMTGSSCTFMSPHYHRAVYWCESGSGEFSNAVNITIYPPDSVLTVSPSWLNPGISVTLSCEVKPSSAGWRFYWYKAVPDLSKNSYRYELLPGSINGTVENYFIIHGQKQTAGYLCRAGRGNPEVFAFYSYPKFIWSADPHPAATLSVSPDREQHFTSESVTLTCGGNSTEWRAKEFTESGHLFYIDNCSPLGTMTGSSCTFNRTWTHKLVVWCESRSGEFSNAVNITFQYEDLLLVSPVHPVTEGASVTLSCRRRGENKLSDVIFYHNDKLIQNDSRGELKISAVSQSDEGFYKCEHSGEVSPQSWMGVKAGSKQSSSSFPVIWVVGSVCGVVLVVLLLLLCCFIKFKDHFCLRLVRSESRGRGSRTNHTVSQSEANEYSSPLHGTSNLYDSVRPSEDPVNDANEHQHITYSLLEFKNSGNKRGHREPQEGAVYADVRAGAAGSSSPAAADAAVYSEVKSGH
ncbi:obscurin-like [Poecilia reticulata]|uniref:obscurin-like n=1 Tax=Poecilia reticulata TaxID=8081 RepID=UPI0007E9FFC9|nr:PREDICTED: obscurin-like [Poecilia reticulata]